jgi:hypothetical protein
VRQQVLHAVIPAAVQVGRSAARNTADRAADDFAAVGNRHGASEHGEAHA